MNNLSVKASSPFIVTSADGTTTFVPGVDYVLPTNPDPTQMKLWQTDAPSIQIITHEVPVPGSLDDYTKAGNKVKVTYETIAVTGSGGAAAPCLSDPAYISYLHDVLDGMKTTYRPDSYSLNIQELGIVDWDAECNSTSPNATPGTVLANLTSNLITFIHTNDPGIPIWISGDMYDPNFNANPNGSSSQYGELYPRTPTETLRRLPARLPDCWQMHSRIRSYRWSCGTPARCLRSNSSPPPASG